MSRPIINEVAAFVPPGSLLRIARELLGWSTAAAAKASRLAEADVQAIETDPRFTTGAIQLEDAYRRAGIEMKAFHGPSGQIFKTRLGDGEWRHVIRRGKLRQTHNG